MYTYRKGARRLRGEGGRGERGESGKVPRKEEEEEQEVVREKVRPKQPF